MGTKAEQKSKLSDIFRDGGGRSPVQTGFFQIKINFLDKTWVYKKELKNISGKVKLESLLLNAFSRSKEERQPHKNKTYKK